VPLQSEKARWYALVSSTPAQKHLTNRGFQDRKEDTGILSWGNSKDGAFNRKPSVFRNFISSKPGAEFPPEAGRYHLYISYACPWAHRTLITRKLKGLEDIIDFTSVHWDMGGKGWRFTRSDENLPGKNSRPNPLDSSMTDLRDLYHKVEPGYEGRYLVPTLYDFKQNKIVSNESSEILRMFYTEFDSILPEKFQTKNMDLFPEGLQKQIEETNEWTYNDINNGVYKSGFATSQEAYEKAVSLLFKSLARADKHLADMVSEGPYYYGKSVTEADIRLYTTIIRFDAVYVQHFMCNIADIRSGFPSLHRWVRKLYWDVPAFHETTEFEHIKKHYTKSHKQINPHSITPLGPVPDILPKDKEVEAVNVALQGEGPNQRRKVD